MSTRYKLLRQAVANLAAEAEDQAKYLDSIFSELSKTASASEYGNDELALALEDAFYAASDMVAYGELTAGEKSAIEPLNRLLLKWSSEKHREFWRRSALFEDERWRVVRVTAAKALTRLPDERRKIGRSA